MSIRLSYVLGALALGGVGACASIVGLDHSTPSDSTNLPSDGDGGTIEPSDGGAQVVGTGTITTEAGVTISPDTIDFQSAPCGTQQTTAVVMTNASDTDSSFTLTLPPGGVFALDGADTNGVVTGTVKAHGETSVTVKATSDQPGDVNADVQVQIGTDTRTITASLETTGGGLTFDPPSLDFGNVRQGTASGPSTITFKNTGNDEIDLSGFSGAADFDTPTTVTLMPNDSIVESITLKAGTAGAPLLETAVPVVSKGQQCGALPSFSLKGTRVDTTVTVNPATLDLGTPSCGSSPVTKTGTISNFSIVNAIPFSATVGSHFTLGTLPPNVPKATDANTPGTVDIPVTIKSVGTAPGAVVDVLTVTYTPDGGSQTSTTVALGYDVQGAVITLPQSSVTIDTGSYYNFGISNSGNEKVCVKYSSDTDHLDLYRSTGTLSPGDKSQVITAGYASSIQSGTTGHITMTTTTCPGSGSPAALCGSAPRLTLKAR